MSHQLAAVRSLLQRIPGTLGASGEVRAALQRIEKEVAAITGIKSDPMRSAAANEMILNGEKSKLRELIGKTETQCKILIERDRAAEAATRGEKLTLVPDAFAPELRTAFRSMTLEQQTQFFAEAIKSRNGSSVAAICLCPSALVGISADMQAQFLNSYTESTAPSDRSDIDEMQTCVSAILGTAGEIATP